MLYKKKGGHVIQRILPSKLTRFYGFIKFVGPTGLEPVTP